MSNGLAWHGLGHVLGVWLLNSVAVPELPVSGETRYIIASTDELAEFMPHKRETNQWGC